MNTHIEHREPLSPAPPFRDRAEAGLLLGHALASHASSMPIVLGIAGGGAIVAAHVARVLGAQLDVWAAGKIGPKLLLPLGAVSEGGGVALDDAACAECRGAEIQGLVEQGLLGADARGGAIRRGRLRPRFWGRVVVLVDDGIETGLTIRAALRAIRDDAARRIVVAAPVVSAGAVELLRPVADGIVALARPDVLIDTGAWYVSFPPVDDAEVRALLDEVRSRPHEPRA
jgi:predicted phosphoribosyltransferase